MLDPQPVVRGPRNASAHLRALHSLDQKAAAADVRGVQDLAARLAEAEARNREIARQIELLNAERDERERELRQAQDQMLAYARDLRFAFNAERERNNLLRNAYMDTVRTLASAIETRDLYTGGHVERVARFARVLAQELSWSAQRIDDLEVGALLHDTGKLGVPDAILRKPGPLDDDEWVEMRKHPQIGAGLVEASPALQQAREAVLHHHERYDGKGYPHGLSGEAIPIEARIVTVVDAYDAMVSTRPYRRALGVDVAVEELERHAGTQFDPECVRAFVEAIRGGRVG